MQMLKASSHCRGRGNNKMLRLHVIVGQLFFQLLPLCVQLLGDKYCPSKMWIFGLGPVYFQINFFYYYYFR